MPKPKVSIKSASTLTDAVSASCQFLKLPVISTTNDAKGRAKIFFHGQTGTDEYRNDALSLDADQKIGKIPGGHEVSKKHNLALIFLRVNDVLRNAGAGESPLDKFWPKTLILPRDQEAAQALLERNKKRKKMLKKTYILKPSSGSQGEGILLLQEPSSVQSTSLMWSKRRSYILQEYVSNPHIIPGYNFKWDMRIYVTLVSMNPLHLVLHKEGLVRFCTGEYNMPTSENLHDTMAHLTNYSLNKRSDNYVNSDGEDATEGSKRALSDVLQLPGMIPDGLSEEDLYDRLGELSFYTMSAMLPMLTTHKYVAKSNRNLLTNAFQTFGLDVLVDGDGGCWLLEVNSNPSMRLDHEGEKSSVDEKVKLNVMNGVVRLVTGKVDHDSIDISEKGSNDVDWECYLDMFDDLSFIYRHLFAPHTGSSSGIDGKSISLTLILFRKLIRLLGKEKENHRFDLVHQRFMIKWREERDREDCDELQTDFTVMDLYDLFAMLEKSGGFDGGLKEGVETVKQRVDFVEAEIQASASTSTMMPIGH
jgi:tubulin polyglutamylase TTLL11